MFSYYGSKRRVVSAYPPPSHNTIIEPFAGAASYSCKHAEGKHVILIDRCEVVVGVWRWLQGCDPEDVLNLPRPQMGQYVEEIEWPCEEAKHFVGYNLSLHKARPALYLTHQAAALNLLDHVIREAVALLPHIRNWTILHGDYREAPDIPATWFIDPPYQDDTRDFYTFGKDTIDYEVLSQWCRERRGQVMVCGGPGSTWLPFEEMGDRGELQHERLWMGERCHP